MKKPETVIYIVDDDQLMVISLKQFLESKFGKDVRITTFNDGESCLKKISNGVNIVILDYFMKNENGLDILKSIKTINSQIEVIMLTSNEDMVIAIESLRAGAKEYVAKGANSESKVMQIIDYSIINRLKFQTGKLSRLKISLIYFTVFTILVVGVVYLIEYRNK